MKSLKNAGFTLIELLIVLAIAAILVSIAYPSYNQYLEKSRRTDGQSALMDLANRMENYYIEHNSYASATLAGNNVDTDVLSNNISAGQWYLLSIIAQDDFSFTLQATPQNAQAYDRLCQSLTLNHLGEKGIAEGPEGKPTGNTNLCW